MVTYYCLAHFLFFTCFFEFFVDFFSHFFWGG
jgi:hypothetical protein